MLAYLVWLDAAEIGDLMYRQFLLQQNIHDLEADGMGHYLQAGRRFEEDLRRQYFGFSQVIRHLFYLDTSKGHDV